MHDLTRRATLTLGAAALAAPAFGQSTIPRRDIPAPRLPLEPGASLRIIRPARFVEPDEVIFRRNAQAFQDRFNIPVRVDSSAGRISDRRPRSPPIPAAARTWSSAGRTTRISTPTS